MTTTDRPGPPTPGRGEDQPYVKPGVPYLSGDPYRLGDHRILCDDATNPADVARRLLDGAAPTLL